MKSISCVLVGLCVNASVLHAAPIFTTLGPDLVQPGWYGDFPVGFWSVEPFRYGAFYSPIAIPEPTLDNPFQPFTLYTDGTWFVVTGSISSPQCGRIQIDADSWDFGIGRLFVWPANCVTGGPGPEVPGGQTPFQPPGEPPPASIPEPAMWLLVGLGLARWCRTRASAGRRLSG